MKILVDTPIWSLALRRNKRNLNPVERDFVSLLEELIREGRAALIGAVRQEVLSGIREGPAFLRLRERLRAFPDEPMDTSDYEEAARCNNECRAKGVAGTAIDYLICAAAIRRRMEILTTDGDFVHYAKHLPIQLHPLTGARY